MFWEVLPPLFCRCQSQGRVPLRFMQSGWRPVLGKGRGVLLGFVCVIHRRSAGWVSRLRELEVCWVYCSWKTNRMEMN